MNINQPFFLDIKKPIIYLTPQQKTRELIPAEKKSFAQGTNGIIYLHKHDKQRVIKKSRYNMEEEYIIGAFLNHVHLVKVHALYIKKYFPHITGAKKDKYKLVMDKIEGKTLSTYHEHSEILSDEIIKKIVKQVQDCCLYLFKQKIIWHDVHSKNIFITNKEQDLMLCDYGCWKIESNSHIRAEKLFLEFLEILTDIIYISSFKSKLGKQGQMTKIKSSLLFPKEFFKTKISLNDCSLSSYKNEVWKQFFYNQLNKKNDEEIQSVLKNYFDCVLETLQMNMEKLGRVVNR
jgi:tRNA A-37 threonylcarbamoyl transferase component Bud32